MTDLPPELPRSETDYQAHSETRIAIVAILAMAIVMLACIAVCGLAATAFLMNPPW
jgi:hypothetical protein